MTSRAGDNGVDVLPHWGRGRPPLPAYDCEAAIKPLIQKALGVRTFREYREAESEFVTISCWASQDDIAAFTGRDPAAIHHLPRDAEFLIELPQAVQVLRLRHSHGDVGEEEEA